MVQRYKIVVEYDGTDLLGWQKQLDGPSVQEFLEKAIDAFAQEKLKFTAPAAPTPAFMLWLRSPILTSIAKLTRFVCARR